MLWHKTIGKGPNLVLLHGWGFSSDIFQNLIEKYKKSYCITVIDLPGHGRSDDVDGGLESWCEELIQFIPNKSILLGWSLGGLLSIYIATRIQLEHLILVAATPSLVNHENRKIGINSEIFHQFAINLKNDSTKILKRFVSLQSKDKSQILELYAAIQKYPATDKALNIGLDILLNSDLQELFKKINIPKSVILGSLDTLVPDEIEDWYKDNKTQSYLLRSGHLPFLDKTFKLPQERVLSNSVSRAIRMLFWYNLFILFFRAIYECISWCYYGLKVRLAYNEERHRYVGRIWRTL